MRLKGKCALVTGSSTGNGAAIAKTFASEGAEVIVHYRSSKERAEAVVKDIVDAGGKAILLQADVASSAEIQTMFDDIGRRFGRLDVLVNNAGLADGSIWNAGLQQITREMWLKVFSVDVFGTFDCIQEAGPLMGRAAGGGSIINISSTPVITGDTMGLVYACAKGSVLTMTKMAARLLAPKIRVNCMILGSFKTEWLRWLSEEEKNALVSSIPLGRFGEPEDVARLSVFLASDESRYITGQGIIIDGGEVMR